MSPPQRTAMATHPLYDQDRLVVDRLCSAQQPDDADLVDAARLLTRYRDFPGAEDLKADISAAMGRWDLNLEDLHAATQRIWSSGWRPRFDDTAEVGSGADVNAS